MKPAEPAGQAEDRQAEDRNLVVHANGLAARPDAPPPVISVITAVLNGMQGSKPLLRLIGSLRSQTVRNFEWIVADGGSTDGTLEVVEGITDFPCKWVSGKDRNLFDAWNRGCRLASGRWYIFPGCDDQLRPLWCGIVGQQDSETNDIVYGNMYLKLDVGSGRLYLRKSLPWEECKRQLVHRMSFQWPGMALSHRLFRKPEPFDTGTTVIGDWKFLLEAGLRNGVWIPDVAHGVMEGDGHSAVPWRARLQHEEIGRFCQAGQASWSVYSRTLWRIKLALCDRPRLYRLARKLFYTCLDLGATLQGCDRRGRARERRGSA